MNKVDEAWQALKKLAPDEQERMAEVILAFAAQSDDIQLSDEQVADIETRMRDRDAPTITIEEVRAHMRKLRS
jgi:putative addiction module component (TIGR02574 family)